MSSKCIHVYSGALKKNIHILKKLSSTLHRKFNFTFSDTFFQLANQSLDPALQKLAKVLFMITRVAVPSKVDPEPDLDPNLQEKLDLDPTLQEKPAPTLQEKPDPDLTLEKNQDPDSFQFFPIGQ